LRAGDNQPVRTFVPEIQELTTRNIMYSAATRNMFNIRTIVASIAPNLVERKYVKYIRKASKTIIRAENDIRLIITPCPVLL